MLDNIKLSTFRNERQFTINA